MSTSKENKIDILKPVPDSENPDPDDNNEQSSKASSNTQTQNDDTQSSPKTSSHDNKDCSKDESAYFLLKEDPAETGNDKLPVNRSITATINKVSPLVDDSKKKKGKVIEDRNRIKSLNVPPEILIEDLGDSDSSSTPLIATKSAFKGPDLSPILKMEHLPQSENESSNNDQDGGEDNGECNQAQNTSEIKTDPTKKNISSRDTGRLLENLPPLNRTASAPVSKRDFHQTTIDNKFAPIRELQTIKSYEKGGQTTLEELVNSLEKCPENLTQSFLEMEDIVNDKEAAADKNELKDDTGETILHHLAKEGCIEILTKILDLEETPKIEANELVKAIIHCDKSGWSPLMAAMKSERNVDEVLDLFLKFLEMHANTDDVDKMTEGNRTEIIDTTKNKKKIRGKKKPENPQSNDIQSPASSRQPEKKNSGNGDNIFTLLISSHTCGSFDNIQILFNMLFNKRDSVEKLNIWLIRIVEELSKANSCDLGSKEMRRVIDLLLKSAVSIKKEKEKMNNDITVESENDFKQRIIKEFFEYQNEEGYNVLMILAKYTMDGALREILTNDNTCDLITHSVLAKRSKLRQTVMSIVEVNREDMPESLALLLKIEYGCHAGDLTQAEICLSGQLETSIASSEILKGLHQLQPLTWCQKFNIWMILFLTWLVPNYGLTAFDWFSDGYLCYEYWNEWANQTDTNRTNLRFEPRCTKSKKALQDHWDDVNAIIADLPTFGSCHTHNYTAALNKFYSNLSMPYEHLYDTSTRCLNETISLSKDLKYEGLYDPCDPLDAYGDCLSGQSKFFYTLIPIIGPVFLYAFEFLVLTEEYEPTGIRKRIKDTWKGLTCCNGDADWRWYSPLLSVLSLIGWSFLAILAVIFWMPVSAWFKYRSDVRYETTTGMEKVKLRRHKRCMDLAASRGELMEASIEDVFEPMIQGYIMFPGMISIIKRVKESIVTNPAGTITLNLTLSTLEIGQIFSVTISMICLAWIFSEYASVRKNMYLDPSESPFSRLIMWFYYLCQVIARLFAFMLFTLYFDPGTFYPLMIFILVHMILAGTLHVIFSEDLIYWKKGNYVKFFHNVTFNALCSIYFHSYIQQDEGYDSKINDEKEDEKDGAFLRDHNKPKDCTTQNPKYTERVKVEHSNQHTSTLLRQVMYDVLYAAEYAVLLGVGFHSQPFKDYTSPLYCTDLYIEITIIVLYIVALALRITYYAVMHVWSNVIWSTKRLKRREIENENEDDTDNARKTDIEAGAQKLKIRTQKNFFKYVFVCRNTWILGEVKNVEITLIILPKWIINNLKSIGENLLIQSESARDDIRLYFAKFRCSCPFLIVHILEGILAFLVFLIVFVILNILVIAILLVLLLLSLPIIFVLFLVNIRNGFVATEEGDYQEVLKELPDINEEEIFAAYPNITFFSIQQSLKNKDGLLDLRKCEQIKPDEFQILAHKLLALDNIKYPLKTIDLTDSCVTDEEMIYLAPLLAKFEKVMLNGTQTLTKKGFTTLQKVLYRMSVIPTSVKLKILELKIKRRKGDLVQEGKGLLFGDQGDRRELSRRVSALDNMVGSEFDGKAMDRESLEIISKFLPKLEELHLDGVFMETKIFKKMRERAESIQEKSKKAASNVKRQVTLNSRGDESERYSIPDIESIEIEPWKKVKSVILDPSVSKRKLKCLSINGCQIDDDTLKVLAPALVTLDRLHIADNPKISKVGWNVLRENMRQNSSLKFLSLKVSDHSKKNLIKNDPGMISYLVELLSQFIKVDISGQKEVTNEIIEQLQNAKKDNFKLEVIIVSRAYYKPNEKSKKSEKPFEIKFNDEYKDDEPRWKREKQKSDLHNTPLIGTKDQMNNTSHT